MGDSFWAKLGPNYNKYNINLLQNVMDLILGFIFDVLAL
jgi:hypothetical protein